jgi:protein-S-isoprenylcysteine O-methyltransferase Ste14
MNVYIFNAVCILWIITEIVLNRILRSAKQDKHGDKNTELYAWLTILVAIFLGIICTRLPYPIFTNYLYVNIGTAIILLGIILRFAAIKQLGKFFTVDVAIRQDHKLNQSGLYKYVRHPSYSGSLLSFMGLGLFLNNWISLAVVFMPIFFAFTLRMKVEEKVLTEQFGKQYTDYMSQTKRVFPFVY